jgi:D-serine deaminase-like pyridoxal phosphate-dependent protein
VREPLTPELNVSLTSLVGTSLASLDTPALYVDLDTLDANILVLSGLLAEHGVNWRPHAKAHKSPAIAHRLLAAGAIGITCAKLSEAEVYAAAGIRDILIANQVVGPLKARRLAELATEIDIISAVDSIEGATFLSDAAVTAGSQPRVLIEVDTGMARGGVAPGNPAVELAKQVVRLPNLRFAGLMSWEGHVLSIQDGSSREEAIRTAIGQLLATAEAIRAEGIPVEIVSCGGTGTVLTARGIAGITEVQAGGGIFGDAFYRQLDVPVEPALFVKVTVTSRPTPTRMLFDAGRKTIDPSNLPPEVVDLEQVESVSLSAEHGTIRLTTPNDTVRVGDSLTLRVGYSDQAVHLHEQIHAVRNGTVVAIWPTLARGRLT